MAEENDQAPEEAADAAEAEEEEQVNWWEEPIDDGPPKVDLSLIHI